MGIGTTTPLFNLSIQAASGDTGLQLNALSGSDAVIRLAEDGAQKFAIAFEGDDDSLRFNRSGNTDLIINSSGNVGIGSTSPYAKLSVSASAGQTTPLFQIASSSVATTFLTVAADGFGTTTLSGLNILGSATSTSNVGFNITSGCFAINGTCVGGGSGSPGGSDGQLQYNNGGSFGGASSLYYDDINNLLGIGSTSPWAKLAVNPVAGDTNQFVVGSSTATSFIINNAGQVGIGTTSPLGKLHIATAGSGTASAQSNADDLVIENSTHVGLSFLSPDANVGSIYFGSPSDNLTSFFESSFSNARLRIGTHIANGYVAIESGVANEVARFVSSGNVGIGTTSPGTKLNIAGGGLSIEGNSTGGFSTPSNGLHLTFDSDDNYGRILSLQNGVAWRQLQIDGSPLVLNTQSGGNVGIGTSTPEAQLEVLAPSQGNGLRLLGANPEELADFYVSSSGNFVIDLTVSNDTANFIDLRPEDDNFGLIIRESSGLTTTPYANFYVADNGSADYLNIRTSNATSASAGFYVNQSDDVGIGTSTPFKRLSVAETVSDAQFAIGYDTTRYATFQVTSVGDLVVDAQGDDVSLLNENLYVCTGGSCPTPPAGTGNLLVEGIFILPQGTAPTVTSAGALALDTSGDDQLLVADEGGTARVIQTKQKIWSVTVASTSPAFISAGLLAIPVELDGYTMTDIRCKVDSGTSKIIAIEDASANSTEDITCATTVTSDDGSITNATATAAEEMYIDFGATSGAVDTVSITVYGYWTRE